MTSLSADRANAQALLGYVRNHWKIENELHSVRDVTLGEDACRVRSGSAPQVLAAFRNTTMSLRADVKAQSQCEAIEILQLNPDLAKQLIGIPQSEERKGPAIRSFALDLSAQRNTIFYRMLCLIKVNSTAKNL